MVHVACFEQTLFSARIETFFRNPNTLCNEYSVQTYCTHYLRFTSFLSTISFSIYVGVIEAVLYWFSLRVFRVFDEKAFLRVKKINS